MVLAAAPPRRFLRAVLAIALGFVVAGCGPHPVRIVHTPSTGATPRTGLMDQWKYKSITTPDHKTVDLGSTSAWLLLSSGGRAQGLDGLPWQGTYEVGDGWVAFQVKHRASLPLAKNAPQAVVLASMVTTKLLSGERAALTRSPQDQLRLSIDGYVLTLAVWD